MPEINLSNSAGRDSSVTTRSIGSSIVVRWVDAQGRQAGNVRVLKAPVEKGIEALDEEVGDRSKVAQALIEGDPEIDLEATGRLLRETSRIYVDQKRHIVHRVQFFELVRNPDSSIRERRPRKILEQNVAVETPLRWSGKFIRKDVAARRFVFASKVQLHHVNGLTYDFLYGIAKELEEKNSLMLLGAGPKANQPLILRRGGSPYRGFLEGRTEGDRYCLILHFSNMELKVPEPKDEEESES